jgi:hypothetical protein
MLHKFRYLVCLTRSGLSATDCRLSSPILLISDTSLVSYIPTLGYRCYCCPDTYSHFSNVRVVRNKVLRSRESVHHF